jgi:hypothetical protein
MRGEHNMYGDGTVYRGERSADSGAAIQRYKIGYYSDGWGERSSTPSGIPDASGAWVRYEDHVAALASTPEQPVAGPANAIPAAHVDNAPFGFTEQEKGAWSVGYEAGASHGQAPADLSPTAGMNIAQRILHVGGRNNDAGYVEFGSIQAVEALVRQVLRDLPAPATADSVQEDAARYRWLREGNDAKHGAAWHVAVNLYGCEWDAAIDAAMKQGGAAC